MRQGMAASRHALWPDGTGRPAVSDYTQAAKLDPRDATTYCHRGIANTRRNELLGAIGDFSKAIELPAITPRPITTADWST